MDMATYFLIERYPHKVEAELPIHLFGCDNMF